MSNKILPIFIFVTLVILIISEFSLIRSKASVSSNILYLTTPIYSFSGMVDSVSGNSVSISKVMTLFLNPNQTGPTQKPLRLTYVVRIKKQTRINQDSIPGDFFEKTGIPNAAANATLKNVKKGDIVSFITSTDLRTLNGNTVDADSINLQPSVKMIGGTIISKDEHRLAVRAVPYAPPNAVDANNLSLSSLKEKTYTIEVTDQTKIIKRLTTINVNNQNNGLPGTYEELKKDMPLTIYTDTEVGNTTVPLKALYLEYVTYENPVLLPSPTPFLFPTAEPPISTSSALPLPSK